MVQNTWTARIQTSEEYEGIRSVTAPSFQEFELPDTRRGSTSTLGHVVKTAS